jgi:ComF family protein
MFGLKDAVNALVDLVLPRRERRVRTENRTLEEIPLSPTSHDLLGVRITTLMEYQNPAVEDLIRSLKYDGSSHAAKLAAELFADYLREEVSSQRIFSAKKILIVPVPLHKSRARERGWNQIELVLKTLPKEFREGPVATFAPHALTRTRATKPQTRLPRSERLSNVAGAFETADKELVHGANIFLVDDVTTTGATLANAATPLRRAGANVILLALARA